MDNTQKVLATINKIIREEKGTRVNLNSALNDSALDSFGYTVLFLELDDVYDIFKDVPDDVDPFSTIDWETATIKEVVEKCL